MKAKHEEFKVILSPGVEAQMAEDEELAKAMKEFLALAHQAFHGVESGQYRDFNQAMEVLTGHRPTEVDLEDDEEE